MLGLYEYSVGRGGNLLLNIGPDRRGLLPDEDSKRFIEFGQKIKERYASPIEVEIKRDGDEFEIISDKPVNINAIVINENLENGESVNAFDVYYHCYNDFLVAKGLTIGHEQIIRIPDTYLDSEERTLKIRITDHDGDYKIDSIKVYRWR